MSQLVNDTSFIRDEIWYAEGLALDTSGSYSHVKRIEQLNTVFWNTQFWILFNSYFLKSS